MNPDFKKTIRVACLGLVGIALAVSSFAGDRAVEPRRQWGQWRGPLNSGVAPHGTPPVVWSESKNVRWKVELPGKGHSTPIVWGDRVFVTTAVPFGDALQPETEEAPGAHNNVQARRRQRFLVLAIDRGDGKIVWQREVAAERPAEGTHVTGSWASASPATDGKAIYASFGSSGIFALEMTGKLRWQTDLGEMQIFHGHGEGSSPALHGDTLVVNWDHQGDSFVAALDTRTGKQRWKTARDEITSWSSPLIVEHDGGAQVIVAATGRVRGYDLASGEQIWECAGLSRNVVATPVAADGIVYVANSYDSQAMLAIRLADAKGDITGSDAVVWTRARHTPYVPSPLLYDGRLFYLKHNQGLLTAVAAANGKTLFGPARLEGARMIFASPVGAAGRVYVVDREGTTLVVAAGAEFELLATNRLDDSFSASPAIVGDELYLRGERNLYCLADDRAESPAPK